MDSATAQRLALVRFVELQAQRMLREPMPLAVTGLLLLHDAAELLVDLVVTRAGAPKRPVEFLGAWAHLEALDPPVKLTHHAAMAKLNRARVSLKHHGQLPARDDLTAYGITVSEFVRFNTRDVFGVSLDEIGLVQLVSDERLRSLLLDAERKLELEELKDAANSLGFAFQRILRLAEAQNGRPVVKLAQFSPRLAGPMVANSDDRALKNLGKFAEKTISALEEIADTLRVMALGIDYQRWRAFREVTPFVVESVNPKHASTVIWMPAAVPTHERLRAALAFVTETAIDVLRSPRNG